MKKLLFFILPIYFLWSLPIYADGMYVSNIHRHMKEPSQKAIIAWDRKKETMILAAAARSSDIANFAWIVPIISRTQPIVTKGDIAIFRQLVSFFMRDSLAYGQALGLKAPEGVEVLESKEIDIYDITVLKAETAKDLMKWLTSNGYKIPPQAENVFQKYIVSEEPGKKVLDSLPPLKTYFVANKVDLRNRHHKEIAEVRRIYAEHRARYDRLCAEANKVLSSFGIQEEIGQGPYTSFQYIEVLGIISNAVHDPANPFKLPRRWSVELGGGIKVEEICSAKPYFQDQRIHFRQSTGHEWAMAVYRNGEFVDVIDYIAYTKNNRHPGRHLHPAQTRKEVTLSKFSKKEAHPLKEYIENREDYHAVLDNEKNCETALEALARDLNQALGTRLWELQKLSQHLFPSAWMMSSVQEFSDGEIPLTSQIASVTRALGTQEQKESIAPLTKAMSDLRTGLATPLKFEFQPAQPNYPLRISSLNQGPSRIEVYVLSERPVIDQSNILRVDQSKTISQELGKSMAHAGMNVQDGYVTRLYYQGLLSDLTADAVFKGGSSTWPSQDILRKTETERTRKIKIRIAGNKKTPLALLHRLAGDPDESVRCVVAGNPGASHHILRRLASDQSPGVRHNVAKNQNAPVDVFSRLAEDPSQEVRWEVAVNPNCPAEVLESLASGGGSKMKLTIVHNPNLPLRVLEDLTQDKDPLVAEVARTVLEYRTSHDRENEREGP